MATEQITDNELLALHALANTRGGVKLGSSVLLRLLNTVDALRAQLAERRGGIPVLTGSILHLLMEWHPEDALGIESVNFQSSADAVNGWLQEKMTSTPSTDVVTVPKEEWDELVAALLLENMSDREMMSWCRDLNIYDPTPLEQMIAKHIWSCAQDWTKRKFSKLRALRSGEAGKDAIYGGEHAAAEIPAILAAHPGYTLPSSHDF